MADSLIDAARKSNVALVKELIGRGADVNGVDGVGSVWGGKRVQKREVAKGCCWSDFKMGLEHPIRWEVGGGCTREGEEVEVVTSDDFNEGIHPDAISLDLRVVAELLLAKVMMKSPNWSVEEAICSFCWRRNRVYTAKGCCWSDFKMGLDNAI